MSETDQGGPSPKKSEWTSPQNVIALAGIGVTVAISIFGVAMAYPLGQDLLCDNFEVACPRAKLNDVRVSLSAIDFDGYCENWLADMRKEQFPPPGFTDSASDCVLDFKFADPVGFAGHIGRSPTAREVQEDIVPSGGGVRAQQGNLIVVHVSAKLSPPRTNIPFSVHAQCRRLDPSISMWTPVPCKLSPPDFNMGGPFGTLDEIVSEETAPRKPLPEGAIRTKLTKNKVDYVQRWRLDIEDHIDAQLTPGDYSVDIVLGQPGEPIEEGARAEALFSVYP